MPVVGLQFTKIVVDKLGPVKGKIQVNNNVVLKDVEKTELSVGTAKQPIIKFHFEFTAKYTPDLGGMALNGYLTFYETPEKLNEIVSGWKKEKKLQKDIMSSVVNTVLSRCNIEAMLLAREVNLPSPIPMPKVQVK